METNFSSNYCLYIGKGNEKICQYVEIFLVAEVLNQNVETMASDTYTYVKSNSMVALTPEYGVSRFI